MCSISRHSLVIELAKVGKWATEKGVPRKVGNIATLA